jgi:hypothetical protein
LWLVNVNRAPQHKSDSKKASENKSTASKSTSKKADDNEDEDEDEDEDDDADFQGDDDDEDDEVEAQDDDDDDDDEDEEDEKKASKSKSKSTAGKRKRVSCLLDHTAYSNHVRLILAPLTVRDPSPVFHSIPTIYRRTSQSPAQRRRISRHLPKSQSSISRPKSRPKLSVSGMHVTQDQEGRR